MECCGKHRPTPFCPECGKALGGEGATLLSYLRQHRKTAARNFSDCDESRDSGNAKRRLLVWDGWIAWVDGKLASDKKSPLKGTP